MIYVTVLDYSNGEVYRYSIFDTWSDSEIEEYLYNEGHRTNDICWMSHKEDTLIKG